MPPPLAEPATSGRVTPHEADLPGPGPGSDTDAGPQRTTAAPGGGGEDEAPAALPISSTPVRRVPAHLATQAAVSVPVLAESNRNLVHVKGAAPRPGGLGKRLFDGTAALIGLALALPVLILCALAVRLTSRGPVLFGHERVGRGGRAFTVLKFRSMVRGADRLGHAITAGSDPRITPIGRLLRRSKLDELPQLWNVLRGDMSLVGPRPEVRKYVDLYPEPLRTQILTLRPGVTGPTTLKLRREEDLLGSQADPEAYYRVHLLPEKAASDATYAVTRTFWFDIRLIFATVFAVITQR